MPAKSKLPFDPELQNRLRYLADLVGGPTALARATGWSTRTVQYYLTGQTRPPAGKVRYLAGLLGVDESWIREGSGIAPSPDPLLLRRAAAGALQSRLDTIIRLPGPPPPTASESTEPVDILALTSTSNDLFVDPIGPRSIVAIDESWAVGLGSTGPLMTCVASVDSRPIRRGAVLLVERAAQDQARDGLWVVRDESGISVRPANEIGVGDVIGRLLWYGQRP
jgi:transcriptional regulator with XRE-family HTH domain